MAQDMEKVVEGNNNSGTVTASVLHSRRSSGMGTRNRCDLEIIATILRATSHNGGMMITSLREKANLSWASLTKYVSSLLLNGLLMEQIVDNVGDLRFARIYRPSERGYRFLLTYNELISTMDVVNGENSEALRLWG